MRIFFAMKKQGRIIWKYQWLHIICSGLISFFLLKGLWSGVWRTRDTIMGGKNPTDISFVSIRNQIQFLDTIKYFQQSLGGLASSLTDKEKGAIYRECEKYLLSDPVLSKKFLFCTKDEKKWVPDSKLKMLTLNRIIAKNKIFTTNPLFI